MKKQLLFAALALAATLTGCSDEESMLQNGENQVKLFIDGTASRVVTDGNATTFETGDAIVINSAGLAPEMENEVFTVSEGGMLETDLSYYYDGNKTATFYAHYPTTATVSAGTVSVTVPSIQNGKDTYNATDFMTATASGSATTNEGAVSLKFAHRLALVKINWEGSTTATDIVMLKLKPTVTWTHATDALISGGTATDIVMWKVDASKQEYWALIPPQTIAKGTTMLEIHDGDKVYPFKPNTDIAFNDKHVRKITLDTQEENGAIEVVATSITVDNWEEDETVSEGNLESTILPQSILISAEQGTFTDVTTLTALTKKQSQAGVWGFDADTDDGAKIELVECPDDNNAKAIHINVPQFKNDGTTTTNWWENAMYYQLTDEAAKTIKPGKVYRLKFKIRSSSSTKQQLRMHVMQANLDNMFFPITQDNSRKIDDVTIHNKDQELGAYYETSNNDGSTKKTYYWLGAQYPFTAEADKYEEKTYFVSFEKITTAGNGTTYRDTPCSIADFDQVALCFAVNNGYGVDFWVKDITFEEYIP